jgi:hypothetical protein
MHGLILTSLAVFFLWHAGLRSVAMLAAGVAPEPVATLVQYAAVALCAWGLLLVHKPTLTWVLAAGGGVTLVNVLVQVGQARVEEVVLASLRRPGRGGPR